MGKFSKLYVAGGLLMTILLSGCASSMPAPPETPTPLELGPSAAASEEPSAEPEQTSTPSPAPDPEEILQAMQQVDILNYIPPDLYVRSEGQKWYEPVLAQPEETLALPAAYIRWVEDAVEAAKEHGAASVALEIDTPTWPLLAAIAANYQGDPENMRTALLKAGGLECEVTPEADGTYLATIHVNPPDAPTLMYELPETETTNPFSLLAAYAYLASVYDADMNERDGVGTPELEEILFPLVNADRYYVGDCWALPRDGGARRHTGTDINAPEGTDLLAVADGVILDNGYNKVAGNYVVLRSNAGIQYHYYHLVEPSDLAPGTPVKTGDVVAHVGNTGNSRANHLHFTIISPEGYYLNPYPYLLESQQRTIAQGG